MDLIKRQEISNKIQKSFVDDFDLINDAKEKINIYLLDMNIDNVYKYNEFCSLFIKITDEMLDTLSVSEFENTQIEYFISEVISIIVKNKIIESELTDEQKSFNLLKMEIDKFKINKSKK